MKAPLPLLRFRSHTPSRQGDEGAATDPLAFHRRLPGYAPSRIRELPRAAEALGVAQVWAKVESGRLGLPSFKVLGASWGAYRGLVERLGSEPTWTTVEKLRAAFSPLRPLALRTATDGNHGRAVAWFARIAGLDATILVPRGTAAARIEAIGSEGASVEVVDGTYDEAVLRAADCDHERYLVVSDTSWEGYRDIPSRVIEGYSTIFTEIDGQLTTAPTVMPVQLGVGALGAAAARWALSKAAAPALVSVEPVGAACILLSIARGALTEAPGPHRSIMAGLNCGLPSAVALPPIAAAFHGFVAIDDPLACDAMRMLAAEGVEAGETGAAGLAGLLAIRRHAPRLAEHVGLTSEARVLLLVTEGPTDPEAFERIVGRRASAVQT
jgi:diaminopropionate ammonia-lyase